MLYEDNTGRCPNNPDGHWQQMKNNGNSTGPCRHKETWWWNEEVAEAVREKKKKYANCKRENSTEAWKKYKKIRQNAKEKKQKERASELNDPNHRIWNFSNSKADSKRNTGYNG